MPFHFDPDNFDPRHLLDSLLHFGPQQLGPYRLYGIVTLPDGNMRCVALRDDSPFAYLVNVLPLDTSEARYTVTPVDRGSVHTTPLRIHNYHRLDSFLGTLAQRVAEYCYSKQNDESVIVPLARRVAYAAHNCGLINFGDEDGRITVKMVCEAIARDALERLENYRAATRST